MKQIRMDFIQERSKKYSKNKSPNKKTLNDLTGKEWIKFSKSWFTLNRVSVIRKEHLYIRNIPAELVEQHLHFFTKEGEYVLDPFWFWHDNGSC